MARTKGVNRSHEIREYLTKNPGAAAKDVVEALAAKGVNVNDGLVYAVKGAMKERSNRRARVVKAAKAASPSTNGAVNKTDALTMIREVKALAQKAGGYQRLKDLVDALAN